jgi:nitrous oxide reductase accessory protein NosL
VPQCDGHRRKLAGARIGIALLALLVGAPLAAHELEVPAPHPTDVCPICGMFVTKYPQWVATLVFRDGTAKHFDGAKDFFKYLFELPKYAPGKSPDDIATMAVTEYYGLAHIDAQQAWFVIGSDVLGPMGHELVPLATAADAEEFMGDHRGTAILRFDDVTPEILAGLDAGPPGRR